MNKWSELFFGLVLLIGVILVGWLSTTYDWKILGKDLDLINSAWTFLQGGFFWLVFLIGLFLVILGISDLKS
ncbi:hypothetical protein HYT23_07030 [Candidatus Pacearchaeota archaeon]|nr:hypothetical protein [Candidatus Pacearchaeota archaeon]